MRRAIWVLAAGALLGPAAMADVNNLSGGAFIVHHEPLIVYTTTPPAGGWCGAYVGHEISAPEQAVIRIDGPGTETGKYIWYVLAAWDEEKTWCGTEFGLGTYNTAVWGFLTDFGPCYPSLGLEIPYAGWPGPNTGTALVTTDVAWEGNWVPVYFFAGEAYGISYGSTIIPISFDPGSANSFCGFSNCSNPPQDYSVPENTATVFRRGGMGINTDGIRAAPVTIPQAVCCIGTVCFIKGELDCEDQSGEWHPELGTSCEGNPCDPVHVCCFGTTPRTCALMTATQCASRPAYEWIETLNTCDPNPCKPAACCVGETCELKTELECQNTAGGTWYEAVESCDPNPCIDVDAACCVGETCTLMTAIECANAGGDWLEGVTDCDPNPCLAACCVGDNCTIKTEADCTASSGVWIEGVTECTPENPCVFGACCFEVAPYCTYVRKHECKAAHPEIGVFTPGEIWHPGGDCNEGNTWCNPSPTNESSGGRIKRLYQ